jgi:uncharacterized protein (DUF4415 family)
MNKKRTSNIRRTHTSRSDWDKVDVMQDENIDASDIPMIPPKQFATALVRRGLKPLPVKKQITLRIDADVLEWFKRNGPGYQTQINHLLRAYVDAHDGQR